MVKWVFADTSYFLALNVNRDRFHQQALAAVPDYGSQPVAETKEAA